MRAVALLSWWKFRNSMRTLFTDPRKLVPTLILIVTFGFSIAMAMIGVNQPAPTGLAKNVDPVLAEAAVTLILIFDAFLVIDTGFGEGLLAFAMPDVDYLFPSPISRRIVLAYRLPALLFTALFTTGMALYLIQMVGNLLPMKSGTVTAATGTVPLAVLLSVGIWMNLALLLSVRIADRRRLRKIEGFSILAFACGLGLVAWFKGVAVAATLVLSPVIKVIFFPVTLAAHTALAANAHQPVGNSILWLVLTFFLSLIPAFASNANWYEQSVVSSERISAMRAAAKGGMASVLAAQASRTKYKASKAYTVKPFGQGALALVWAHLCAAAKRPWANFVGPLIAGLGLSAWGVIAGLRDIETSMSLSAPMVVYSSLLFLGAAKTASEAAIRRRELLAPLPVAGWQSVAANLSTPFLSVLIFCGSASLIYGLGRGPSWPYVVFGIGLVYPLRLAARMVLQYAQVLAHPDLADKVQQFLSQGIYYLFAAPLVIAEVIVCVPAIVLKSWWVALITLAVFEAGLLALLLILAGKASEKSIASGEPVSLWRLIRKSG